MTYATLCSGIGAPELAFAPLGWRQAFCAEIEPFPCAVLARHFPNVPNLGDITQFKSWPDYAIDLLVAGTPCQSFSLAGLRAGINDPRGNLALVFLAIIDRYHPRWVLWENVPGVHSAWSDAATHPPCQESIEAGEVARRYAIEAGFDDQTARSFGEFVEVDQTNDFDCFLSGLEKLGYGIATTILDAQFFGLAQRRNRVFVVGHSGGLWQRAAAVLSLGQSVPRHPPPREEAGQSLAPTIGARVKGGGGLGTDAECGGALIPIPQTAHTLSANGFDGSEDGTGRGTPIVPVIVPQAVSAKWAKGTSSPAGDEVANLIAFQPRIGRNGRGDMGDKCNALNAQSGQSGKGDAAPCVAFQPRYFTRDNKTGGAESCGETAAALSAQHGGGDSAPCVARGWEVRRLTSGEVAALQGFPRDWCAINFRGKPAADGPQYRAYGNAMAVPVIKWIGDRIRQVDSL